METTASSPSILVSVGLSFVTEYDEHVSSEKLSILERALTDFLENRKSFFETAQIYQTTIGTTKPIDRIATILQTPDLPIPNFSMFNQGGSSSRKKTRSWTEYEDQRLLAGIHRFGTDNWLIVANFVGNGRTRAQCSQRWIRGLDPRISKDKWSKEDEELLLRLVEQYGTKCWTRIAQEMGNRSDVQCRYRYYQIQKLGRKDGFSSDDMKENFYHGLLLGLLRGSNPGWLIKSNRESGDGFSDILIEPEDPDAGIVIEVKYAKEMKNLDAACEAAMAQIKNKRYDEALRDEGR